MATKSRIRIELYENRSKFGKKGFWVRYKGKNGKVIAHSETFARRAGAVNNMKAMASIFMGYGTFSFKDMTDPARPVNKAVTLNFPHKN